MTPPSQSGDFLNNNHQNQKTLTLHNYNYKSYVNLIDVRLTMYQSPMQKQLDSILEQGKLATGLRYASREDSLDVLAQLWQNGDKDGFFYVYDALL